MSQQLTGADTRIDQISGTLRGIPTVDTKKATALHVPTFVWAVVAFLVAILLYHLIWGK
jgi:hypothetical protein